MQKSTGLQYKIDRDILIFSNFFFRIFSYLLSKSLTKFLNVSNKKENLLRADIDCQLFNDYFQVQSLKELLLFKVILWLWEHLFGVL